MSLLLMVIVAFIVVACIAGYEYFEYVGAGEEEYSDGEFVSDENKDAK